ncbi:MAG: hypothetical protein LQ340_007527 [Diploschistes diacapsis]|nr:MAG: hypothetical protein LQ340_007527 [Diploschistes diacapsis]
MDSTGAFDVVSNIHDLRVLRNIASTKHKRVALVPTMGALHSGHLKLIKHAARHSESIYVSIYVNPTQFGVNEDLDTYPRTLDEDLRMLRELNKSLLEDQQGTIACVFTPTTREMYPVGLEHTSHLIMSPRMTQTLEGKARPTFFQGVTTVVLKLLNIVQPEKVFFGQKDIQQLVIINRMVKEFHLNVEVYRVPTERNSTGLALSSRNAYLGERRKNVASVLFRSLRACREWFHHSKEQPGARSALLSAALDVAKKVQDQQRELPPSERARFELEYLSLADPLTLEEVEHVGEKGAILSGAVVMLPLEEVQVGEKLGIDSDARRVRLIDNILLGFPENSPDVPFSSLGANPPASSLGVENQA